MYRSRSHMVAIALVSGTLAAALAASGCTGELASKPDGSAPDVDGGNSPVDGSCDAANGVETSGAPTDGLCGAGTPSSVAGSGPWTWTCAGRNGGSTASCSAPVKRTTSDIGTNLRAAGRTIDWTFAGVPGGIPHRTKVCATFNPGATASAINLAIASCNDGVVQLNAGTYSAASLGGGITVNNSNVTLRGAGADQTTLTGCGIVSMGSGYQSSLGTAITGGATKGSTSFTVASPTNLAVGTMIEVDRDDDTNIVVNTGGGRGRSVDQVNMITAVNNQTITVRNPFFFDFSTGNPKVKFSFPLITQKSGVEDMQFDHNGFSGCYYFMVSYCDSCWVKGVESARATGYHFVASATLNVEFRDSYIHEGGSGPNNSGINFYGNYTYGTNSSGKIENVIFNKNFPAIEINNSSSGLYIGYNYSYGSMSQYGANLVTWTFDDGHAPFNVMNLYEGNTGEMFGMDGYFGGSGLGTVLRNYFLDVNLNYDVTGDAIQIKRLGYYYNIVGNVLGATAQKPKAYDTGCDVPDIFQLGYPNIGNCDTNPYDGFTPAGGYPDPKVASSMVRWGNYDHFNKVVRWDSAEVPSDVQLPSNRTIPASLYYSAKPAWFPTSVPWPLIGPDVTGGTGDTAGYVHKSPAQLCWEGRNLGSGGTFNAAACYQ